MVSILIYIEAGQHLTPYSVSVRGYYRSDGTYVRPHSRRPPGGAIHDVPYESKRFLCMIFILVGLGLFCYAVYSFRKLNKNELLWIIKNEIRNEIEENIDSKLPSIKTEKSFSYYNMDNYNEYHKEEERYINDFIVKFTKKTNIKFNDIGYLKKAFKNFILHIKQNK